MHIHSTPTCIIGSPEQKPGNSLHSLLVNRITADHTILFKRLCVCVCVCVKKIGAGGLGRQALDFCLEKPTR